MVSPAPTRSLHLVSRCRFISSMLQNGRLQTSRIERNRGLGAFHGDWNYTSSLDEG